MKKELNIAFLGTRGIPNQYGGFEQAAEFISRRLVSYGHQVTVYCSDQHPSTATEYYGVNLLHISDPESSLGTIGQFIYDWNCIKHARKQDYDVIIQFGYTSSSIWYWFWPRKAKHIVNMDGKEYLRSKYNRPVRGFLRLAERLATWRSNLLIADNVGIEEYLMMKYPSKRTKYIAYGAEVPTIENSDQQLADFGLAKNNFDLIICRLEPENNPEVIIKAALRSEEKRKLVVVGSISNSYAQKLQRLYASENVEFLGGVYDNVLLDQLRFNSHTYFHGHSVGGTNPSLLEAMASCKRIIAHDNEYNRSVLASGGLYFSNEASLLRAILEFYLIDWEELLSTNQERLKKDYSWDQIAKQYEAACYEVVEG